MNDVLTPAQRSFCMSRNRGSNTKPEILLRRAMWKLGLRYRIQSALPGRPDIIFPTARTAVFVDGCFWHGCPDHFQEPRSNAPFWAAKIARTVERDRQSEAALLSRGWHVIRIWEHDIKKDVGACARQIELTVYKRRFELGRRPHNERLNRHFVGA